MPQQLSVQAKSSLDLHVHIHTYILTTTASSICSQPFHLCASSEKVAVSKSTDKNQMMAQCGSLHAASCGAVFRLAHHAGTRARATACSPLRSDSVPSCRSAAGASSSDIATRADTRPLPSVGTRPAPAPASALPSQRRRQSNRFASTIVPAAVDALQHI